MGTARFARGNCLTVIAQVGVLLASPRHVGGLYDTGNARLSDALNNTLESVIRLTNARLGRLGNLTANEPAGIAIIPKSQVAIIYALLEATPPVERRLASWVPKKPSEVLILVAGLRVRGHMHASGNLEPVDLHRIVVQAPDRFVVVTDALLAVDIEGSTEREIGVAMINTRHIQFVARGSVDPAVGEPVAVAT